MDLRMFDAKYKSPLESLARAKELTSDSDIRFACVSWQAGKADKVCASKACKELIELLYDNCIELSLLDKLPASDVYYLLERLDAFRRKDRFDKLLICIEAIYDKQSAEFLKGAYEAAVSVDIKSILKGNDK